MRLLPLLLAPALLAAAPPQPGVDGESAQPVADQTPSAAVEIGLPERLLRAFLRAGILATSKDRDKKWIAPPAPRALPDGRLDGLGAADSSFRGPPPPGTREAPWLHFVNLYSNDHLAVFGDDVPPRALSLLLRCRATGKTHPIDPALPAIVLDTARKFRASVVQVISGYRHDKFNEQLRKKCREVASESYHRFGQAIDWRLQGIPLRRIVPHLLRRHRGGVGVYSRSNFVHTDTGPQRTWRGR